MHFKNVHQFYQSIFIIFSHLKNTLHNLVIELCNALNIFQKNLQLFIKITPSFVAIELLTFIKNAKFHFYCSRELSVFWLNKLYSLRRTGSIKKNLQLFIKVTRSFVAIESLTFCNNAKFHFNCSRELSFFWINKLYSLTRKGYI